MINGGTSAGQFYLGSSGTPSPPHCEARRIEALSREIQTVFEAAISWRLWVIIALDAAIRLADCVNSSGV